MKQKLLIISIIFGLLFIFILILNNVVYYNEGEKIFLEKNKKFELILNDIYIDEKNGPQLDISLNTLDNKDYYFEVNVWNYNGVYEFHKMNNDKHLYWAYKRDLNRFSIDENIQILQDKGLNYTKEEYKNAYDTLKEIGISVDIFEVNELDSILAMAPLMNKIKTINKKIVINEHKNKENVFKKIYYKTKLSNINFYNKNDLILPPENAAWLNFEDIISQETLSKIQYVNILFQKGWTDYNLTYTLDNLEEKKYAECTKLPDIDSERETYEFLDKNGNLVLKINSCIILDYSKTTYSVEITKLYKIIIGETETYYWINPVSEQHIM